MVTASDISADPDYSKAMIFDMVLSCGSGPDVAMSLSSRSHRSGCIPVLRLQPGLRWLVWPGASSWCLMAAGTTYFSPGPGCYRATDPDKALGSRPGPDDTLFLGGSMGHPYLYGTRCGMTPWLHPHHRFWPTSWASVWDLVTACATEFNTDPSSS